MEDSASCCRPEPAPALKGGEQSRDGVADRSLSSKDILTGLENRKAQDAKGSGSGTANIGEEQKNTQQRPSQSLQPSTRRGDRQQGINSPEVPELLLLIVPKRFRVCPLQKAQVVGKCVPGVSLFLGSYWNGKRKAKGGSRAAKMQVA